MAFVSLESSFLSLFCLGGLSFFNLAIYSSLFLCSYFRPNTYYTKEHFGNIFPILSVRAISSISGSESDPDSDLKEYFYLFLLFIAATSAKAFGRYSSASTHSLSLE